MALSHELCAQLLFGVVVLSRTPRTGVFLWWFFFCSGYLAPFLMAGQEKCKLPVAIRGIVPLGGFLLMAPPQLTTPVGSGS